MSIPSIAVVGYAGAGKTTVAEALINHYNTGFERASFAEPLKVMLGTSTDRARLQEFGTDVVRRYEPHAWVRLFRWSLDLKTRLRLEQARGRPDPTPPVLWVADDVRFPNELMALKDMDWAVIRVNAPKQLRIDRLKRIGKLTDDSQLEHISEHALDGFDADYNVYNVGDVVELQTQLDRILIDLERTW